MFPHTSLKLFDILTMQRQVVIKTLIKTLFLALSINIIHGIYIHPENQTPSTTAPAGGTVSSALPYPPSTPRSDTSEHKSSNKSAPQLNYETESAIYYEYETINQTNGSDSESGNEEEFCSFTLYVSQNSEKNANSCKVQSNGDSKTQCGKSTTLSSGPRASDVGLRRRLGLVERRLDLLERQLFRQSGLMAKLQNQMFGVSQSNEDSPGRCITCQGGVCDNRMGWVKYGNSCYWFGAHHVSWDAARVICKAKGINADLAVPSDEDEARLLASYMEFYDPHYSWWLGCSQYKIGDWQCVDGLPLNYTNWNPSNYDNHRCLQLGRPPKMGFVDTQCNQKWPFACEKPLPTTNQFS